MPSIPKTVRDRLSTIFTELQSLQFSVDNSPFQRRIFVPLPNQHVLSRIMQSQLESLQIHGVVFSTSPILALIDEQFLDGGKSSTDDPSRWALINALLASTMLCKVTNEYPEAYTRPVWGLFKNAFALFPELMIQKPTLQTCEALIAMVFFMQGHADARTMVQLITALSRIVQELGLGKQVRSAKLAADEATRVKHILWATYIFTADVADSLGLPPLLGRRDVIIDKTWIFEDDPEVQGISVGQSDRETPDVLRCRATLAAIQLQIHEDICEASLHDDNTLDAIQTVTHLDEILQGWRSSNDAIIRRRPQGSDESALLPWILVNFIYTTCQIKISTALSHLAARGQLANKAGLAATSVRELRRKQKEYRTDYTRKARSIIDMLDAMPTHPFFQIW